MAIRFFLPHKLKWIDGSREGERDEWLSEEHIKTESNTDGFRPPGLGLSHSWCIKKYIASSKGRIYCKKTSDLFMSHVDELFIAIGPGAPPGFWNPHEKRSHWAPVTQPRPPCAITGTTLSQPNRPIQCFTFTGLQLSCKPTYSILCDTSV